MAKNDQGYVRAKQSSYSGGYGNRGMQMSTFLAKVKKDRVVQYYIRDRQKGILDILGQQDNQDLAMEIKQIATDEVNKMTKKEIGDLWNSKRLENSAQGAQAYLAKNDQKKLGSAQRLMDALYSATKATERIDLEDGELLDDPTSLLVDGQGWGDETKGRLEVRKHVNIAMDNSGSTHMPETGFCSDAIQSVTNNLIEVLDTAGSTYPYLTTDAFSFNRVTVQHTGNIGRNYRKELAYTSLRNQAVYDPLKKDAVQTNLAPLLEQMYKNEVERNKIGEPRIDIIITDGEFESVEDLDEAVEWQRKRGPNVTTYVLNLVPEEMANNLPLPYQFRVVPVNCIGNRTSYRNGEESTHFNNDYTPIKEVDNQVLSQVLNNIVIQEVSDIRE
tara:strand:+ start:6227 stop:7387 length:1161 start_codon:yes stop_codon:yes gene_type:complete